MDTLEPIIRKSPGCQSVLIIQVSLYDKAVPFGTITKSVDYAGVFQVSTLTNSHCMHTHLIL